MFDHFVSLTGTQTIYMALINVSIDTLEMLGKREWEQRHQLTPLMYESLP